MLPGVSQGRYGRTKKLDYRGFHLSSSDNVNINEVNNHNELKHRESVKGHKFLMKLQRAKLIEIVQKTANMIELHCVLYSFE